MNRLIHTYIEARVISKLMGAKATGASVAFVQMTVVTIREPSISYVCSQKTVETSCFWWGSYEVVPVTSFNPRSTLGNYEHLQDAALNDYSKLERERKL
jgi:hypothetical protein